MVEWHGGTKLLSLWRTGSGGGEESRAEEGVSKQVPKLDLLDPPSTPSTPRMWHTQYATPIPGVDPKASQIEIPMYPYLIMIILCFIHQL